MAAKKSHSFSRLVLRSTRAVMSAHALIARPPSSPNLTFQLKSITFFHTCSMAASGTALLHTREIPIHDGHIKDDSS